jgi:hypothetical protein
MARVSEINFRHGGPYDRGAADSYYRRPRRPHFFRGDTYNSEEVLEENMTEDEIYEYNLGFDENEESDNHKDWA